AHGRIELTQEILLLFRQVDGRLHDDSTEQIALLAASHRLHAFFAQTEYAARLRLRGNLELDGAAERRHLDRAAERRDDEADRYLARQMGAIALEDRMFANANLDIQIARRSAISPRLALSGQADPVAGIDAFRHFDVERLLLAYPSLTGIARQCDRLVSPLAARRRLSNGKEALLYAHLPDAVTRFGGDGLRAGCRAGTVAWLALSERRELDGRVVSEDRLLEVELEIVPKVCAAIDLTASAATPRAKDVAEHVAEDVAEGIRGTEPPAASGCETFVPMLVVDRAPLRIGEDLIGFLRLFELLLRLLIVGIAIGVILHRQPAVRFLDLGFGRR